MVDARPDAALLALHRGNPARPERRQSRQSVSGIKELPLLLALPYLLLTYALFWLGPYDWPVKEWWVPSLYVPTCFFLLALGFTIGRKGRARVSDFRLAPPIGAVGIIAALVLWVPTAVVYTGKAPWNFGAALADQKAAYSALSDQLYATQGSRGPLAAVRALCGPFVFCVLPMAVMLWHRLTLPRKVGAVLTALVYVNLSILRGTTRELADIVIVCASAFLVRFGFSAQAHGHSLFSTVAKRWKTITIGGIILAFVIVSLVGRAQIRANGRYATCIGYSHICADLNRGIYAKMSDPLAFGAATVTGYLSQGYYGLSLVAEKDWRPTFPIGHSPPLSALFVSLGGDEAWANRTYTYRARIDAWSDETQWSSMWAWLANDASLWGALVFTFGLGWLWGRTWIDALAGDIRAAILFCIVMLTIFYAPANFQIAGTFEGYATLLFWLALWAMGRQRRYAINPAV